MSFRVFDSFRRFLRWNVSASLGTELGKAPALFWEASMGWQTGRSAERIFAFIYSAKAYFADKKAYKTAYTTTMETTYTSASASSTVAIQLMPENSSSRIESFIRQCHLTTVHSGELPIQHIHTRRECACNRAGLDEILHHLLFQLRYENLRAEFSGQLKVDGGATQTWVMCSRSTPSGRLAW